MKCKIQVSYLLKVRLERVEKYSSSNKTSHHSRHSVNIYWIGNWEGSSRGRRHMYTYGWLLLMFDRKQNAIKQLSFD